MRYYVAAVGLWLLVPLLRWAYRRWCIRRVANRILRDAQQRVVVTEWIVVEGGIAYHVIWDATGEESYWAHVRETEGQE